MDVLVIGAGAAGLMAGIEAARRGRRVLVVDHAAKPGEKIRISGGGRCNFTNLNSGADRFVSQNPRFALSALSRFTARDFIARLAAHRIPWEEREHGQLFCTGSAKEVVAMLLADLAAAGGEIWTSCPVGIPQKGAGFTVETPRGAVSAASVIVATGGKSIPKMGATGFGYDIAAAYGLALTETRPGLVPLTFAEQELSWIAPLAGVSVPARVRAGRQGFEESVLFTHRGLSGPAILQISNYWREGEEIALDLFPGTEAGALLLAAKRGGGGRSGLAKALSPPLPERLARHLADRFLPGAMLATVADRDLQALGKTLSDWRLKPVGTEGYRTAEVTLGGVDTKGLDAKTLMARSVPGLYFVGEVVDVTGWLGGYNFQWAWASGWAAGQVA